MIRMVSMLALSLMLFSSQVLVHGKDAKRPNPAIKAEPRNAEWWTSRHAAMNKRVKEGNVDLLFIGDSITQGWEGAGKQTWDKFYGKRNAVNLGISGDQTQHVIWRLDHGNIDGINPKAAVIMIGTNNSGAHTGKEIADGVKVIVSKLRKKHPKLKVLVLAIFPRGANDADARRKVVMEANVLMKKSFGGKDVAFLDIGPKLMNADGTISRDVMPDLLHLSPKGYTIWAESIEPTLAKLLGEK